MENRINRISRVQEEAETTHSIYFKKLKDARIKTREMFRTGELNPRGKIPVRQVSTRGLDGARCLLCGEKIPGNIYLIDGGVAVDDPGWDYFADEDCIRSAKNFIWYDDNPQHTISMN